MEHLHHFGLPQDPFSNEPDLRFYFESASHRDAQRRVERGIRQSKGLTVLTGEGGMGKTLLTRRILETLEEEVFEATLLVMLPGAADATGILQRFARQLGCEEPARDRAGLLGQLYEQLAIVREDGRHAVLMVDDAQIMTPDVFAELGGLLNLEYEDRRLVSMLFVGSPELDEMVQNDAGIMPRVDVRVRLQPLDMDNTTAYLKHRLASVRANADVLPAAAIETLFKFGRGRPRLLNTLADNALFEAYLAGRPAIDPSDVERAAADLGVGPDPGMTYSPPAYVAPTVAAGVPDDVLASVSAAPALAGALLAEDPGGALDLDEPVAEFELVAEPTPAQAVAPTAPGLDLDSGSEAAFEDFGENTEVSRLLDSAEFGGEELELDLEAEPEPEPEVDVESERSVPADEPMLEFVESDAVFETAATPKPSFVAADVTEDYGELEPMELETEMAEAELSPLEFGEADELDDAFVELLEE